MKQLKKPILILMIVGSATFAWFMVYSLKMRQQTLKTGERVRNTNEVIKQLQAAMTAVAELESGERGFMVTGDPAYVPSYCEHPEHIFNALNRVSALVHDNPLQQKLADSLQQVVRRKVSHSCQVISLSRQSLAMAYPLVSSGYGPRSMDTVRRISRAMLREENRLLNAYIATNNNYHYNVLQIAMLTGICTFLICLTGLFRINKDMRLRENAEKDLRQSELKYRELVQGAHVVMYTCNRGGYFTFISKQAAALTGYADTELIGLHYSVNLSPETHERLKAFYVKQLEERTPVTYTEFEIITKTGEKKWVEQEAILIYKDGEPRGYQCVVKDITEKKQMALELEKTQYHLQYILDFSPTIIFIKDLEGRYLLVNKRFEEMHHTTKEAVLGKTDFDLSPADRAELCVASDQEVLAKGQPVNGVEIMHINGKELHYHYTKFPLMNEKQQVYGVCGICIDITERARYENELIEARTTAERAQKSQEMFLANMSHEIRTPMNGIIGMTNLLLNTPLTAEQKEYINTVKQSAGNLLVIVNEILDFSKLHSGKMMLEQISFRLREVIEQALFPLQHQAQQKGLRFSTGIERGVPDQLMGDPVRLSQVLVNLVENAIKFTPAGAVDLQVQLRETDHNRVRLYFEVSDTGIGIPADKQQMIFESFTQSNAENARRFGGTGLGLAISKELVELQGGSIAVKSQEGEGTTFYFEIPFTKNVFSQEAAQAETTASEQPQVLKGVCLLIVEDNEINQKVAFHTLRKAGARVDMAFDGVEAINYLQQTKYDCIIMDIQMPEMDGYDATARIREMGITTPVIAMTASAIQGEREKCILAGMNDYISKPFVPDELFRKILQYTGQQVPVHFNDIPIRDTMENALPTGLVDFDYLRSILFHDPANIQEMLQEFLLTMPETTQELQEAGNRQEWDRVFFLTHRLKSSLGIVRIHHAMELTETLENDARLQQHVQTIPERIARLSALLHAACKEVQVEIARMDP